MKSSSTAPTESKTDADRLMQMLMTFAGRIAQTSDPVAHQAAGKQLHKNLESLKIKGDQQK